MRILLTGGGGAGNEALFRCLGNRYSMHFADADIDAISPIIPEENRHQIPWASDSRFVDKLASLCEKLEVDLLVPGVDEELLILASNADKFGRSQIMLPSEQYIEVMLDKLSMIEKLASKNIPVPKTAVLSSRNNEVGLPCISKPRKGRGSRGVQVLYSKNDIVLLKDKLGSLSNCTILQEKIVGEEYTVQMLCDREERLCAVVPVKVSIKRGITLRAETVHEQRVMDACRRIHAVAPASGCYNIQLILTEDGQVLPFEINPRISTTLCLVVASGLDPFSIFINGVENYAEVEFEGGVGLQRHWANFFKKSGSECFG